MAADAIVTIVAEGLRLLAAVAPAVARAFTGGQSPEDAIKAAREALDDLPQALGDDGLWAQDLDRRKAGG